MSSLISVIISDIEAAALEQELIRSLSSISSVKVLIKGLDYRVESEINLLLKSISKPFDFILVLKTGEVITQNVLREITDFLKTPNSISLAVNYVHHFGANSKPRIWSKRILVVSHEYINYDGFNLIPPSTGMVYSDQEIYNILGVGLKLRRLKEFSGSDLNIYSSVGIFVDWIAVRQYRKAWEVGKEILASNLDSKIRYFVLNQLASIAAVEGDQENISGLLTSYSGDLSNNPLVLADYYFLSGQYEEVLTVLEGYTEPDIECTGLPYDIERYRAYVYYLQAKVHLLQGNIQEAVSKSSAFYKHSVVLRYQIKWVKLLENSLASGRISNAVNNKPSTPPAFLVVAQPRTGSTWLQTLLNSHSQIDCYGELLALDKPREMSDYSNQIGDYVYSRARDPITFLSNQFNGSVKGFKLHLFQLDYYSRYNLWSYLLDNGNTKIIYLKRRDVVAAYCSFVLASQNNYWQTDSTDVRIHDVCEVNIQHFKTYMEKMSAWENRYISSVQDKSLLVVYYEDLLANSYSEILNFLEVRHHTLLAKTVKQNVMPLHNQILNLSLLKSYYSENPLYK